MPVDTPLGDWPAINPSVALNVSVCSLTLSLMMVISNPILVVPAGTVMVAPAPRSVKSDGAVTDNNYS